MYTVSQRTKKAKQPRGGYLPPKQFEHSSGLQSMVRPPSILMHPEKVPSMLFTLNGMEET